jgi:hypothetical protein
LCPAEPYQHRREGIVVSAHFLTRERAGHEGIVQRISGGD